MAQQGTLFDKRFLETYAGHSILRSPRTAIVELVANAWDAGATHVEISWPDRDGDRMFSIRDNGNGMTAKEFQHRWRTLSYDRLREQGSTVQVRTSTKLPPRPVFGRNGIGRFAGFYFADEYSVETWRDGETNTFRVLRGDSQPLKIELVHSDKKQGAGTRVFVDEYTTCGLSAEDIRAEIGMRFLTDPNFVVRVDRQQVAFSDIREGQINEFHLPVEGVGEVQLIAIDTQKTDRTTRQHGVAWRVKTRLVGDCSWKGPEREKLIDGRRIAAKRFTFIVIADCLEDMVTKDWSGFDENGEPFQKVAATVYEKIDRFLGSVSRSDQRETLKKAREANRSTLDRLSVRETDKWETFVETVQRTCPSLREKDLVQLSTVLANLEESHSRYALVQKLGEYGPQQLDDLHKMLADWTLDMMKEVLDEIQMRLLLLDELKRKVTDEKTQEVQELQPLFRRGLWIFGPEFETIEFTSNEGMTTVIQRLFKPDKEITGSKNRPDFVVLPDGSVGFYSYPRYDAETAGEIGVDRLVIIELKKPGIPISTEQKDQCWKYVKELRSKGLLQNDTCVTCYPLGQSVDPQETAPRDEGNVRILPLTYQTVIDRAKSRMLKLYDRVKDAPFMDRKEARDFLKRAKKHGGQLQRKLFAAGDADQPSNRKSKRKPR